MQRSIIVCAVLIAALAFATAESPALTAEKAIEMFKARFETMMKRPNLVQGKRFNAPSAPNACNYRQGKYVWDLEPLKSATDLEGTDPDNPTFSYKMSVCSEVTSVDKCSASVCQTISGQEQDTVFALGYFNKGEPIYAMVDPADLSKGVRMTLSNGDDCTDSASGVTAPRKVNIDFECSTLIEPTFRVSQSSDCVYGVKYGSPSGCYKEAVDPQPAKETGLSGGSVFIIIVVVSTFVYVVAGCLVNYFKNGLTGLDACPQKEFWCSLPSLVQDGCSFTYRKIRSLCTKTETTSSGEYQTTI